MGVNNVVHSSFDSFFRSLHGFGKCSWKNPNDGSEYSGRCSEGKWGEGEFCFCGSCYLKPCEPTPTCNGKCQRRSPGKGWTSTSYCNKETGCKCWEKIDIQPKCYQDPECLDQGGRCIPFSIFPNSESKPQIIKKCKSFGTRPCYCMRKWEVESELA